LRTGDVLPTPYHGVEHHIHIGSHSPVFAKACSLDPEKLKLPKQNLGLWNPLVLSGVKNHYGLPLCTWSPKKMDHDGLAVNTAVST
jgi:hypothetical protein